MIRSCCEECRERSLERRLIQYGIRGGARV